MYCGSRAWQAGGRLRADGRRIVHNSKLRKPSPARDFLPKPPGIIRPMSLAPALPPVVLCISGHDPCGGAGIQADIEAVRAQGAHPATIITALTVQDSRNAYAVDAVEARAVIEPAALI